MTNDANPANRPALVGPGAEPGALTGSADGAGGVIARLEDPEEQTAAFEEALIVPKHP